MYSYSVPYLTFLAHFHLDRDYFECHEVLEEHWKHIGGSRSSVYVGLIQTAVSLYHYRRGNVSGAERTANRALHNLSQNEAALTSLGIDPEKLTGQLSSLVQDIRSGNPFQPFSLPLFCSRLQKELDLFGQSFHPSQDADYIANKHVLRDRSAVMAERDAAKQKKQAGRVTIHS